MEKDRDSGESQDYGDEDDDEDSDENIDMLASARVSYPQNVAARAQELEMQAGRKVEDVLAGSSAVTVDGGSRFSSAGSEISMDIELN